MKSIKVGKATIILAFATVLASIVTATAIYWSSDSDNVETSGDCSPVTKNIGGNLTIIDCKPDRK